MRQIWGGPGQPVRRPPSALRRKRLGLLLIWLGVALLLSHEIWQGLQGDSRLQFETAFGAASRLERAIDSAPAERDATTNTRTDATKAMYYSHWQQGGCSSYAPPLDMVCLDSVISFGVEGGKSFFASLPDEPKAAALEVINHRMAYRQRAAIARGLDDSMRPDLYRVQPVPPNFPLRPRAQERALALGLQRDRALLGWVETYSPASNPVSVLLKRFQIPTPLASPEALSSGEIFAKAEPFTVEIWITLEDGTSAPATGVLVSADGLVLTNAHVVEGNPTPAVRVRDRQQNEQQFWGRVVTEDARVDLALIQLTGAVGLPIAPLADSTAQVQVGDRVYALGSPVGSHWKLTEGEVIALESQCGVRGLKCIRMPRGFLQPGNSGGPLLDVTGTVIGINRALQESTGEGVSIPIEVVQQFLRQERQLAG